MESIGIIVGVVVAIALGTYIRHRRGGQPFGLRQAASVALAAALGAAIAAFGLTYLRQHLDASSAGGQQAAVDRAMQTIHETPLLRLVAAENPAIDAQFRKAVEEQIRNPQEGTNKLFELGTEIRRQNIIPILKNADDTSALAANRANQALTVYLHKDDPALCKQFGDTGIQNPQNLKPEGIALFKQALSAQEDAYRNGKTQTEARPAVSDQELARLLAEAGYTSADFDALATFVTLPPAAACDALVKLYAAPARLPPARGAVLARYLLTVQQ